MRLLDVLVAFVILAATSLAMNSAAQLTPSVDYLLSPLFISWILSLDNLTTFMLAREAILKD
ncbi:hypothetical protein CCR75_008072 [Bremia lactucae]|uniref:Uncharacterized protein n=1 Tax=Bremia lactucae TaxID=4779 RepID=A0A976IG48_BRELC|nr:hypothetical protein CCR75_008072 [Bremia lactucae]